MDIDQMDHFGGVSAIVDALSARTQNYEKSFYRNLVNYNLCKAASMMRTSVAYPGRGDIPVNYYGISLAPSGFSKGFSTNIIEDEVMVGFLDAFKNQTFPELAQRRIVQLAHRRALNKNTDPDDEQAKLEKDYESSGELLTEFDEATVPAVKQNRRKLQIADAGSLNYMVDEIGQNLIKSQDVLTAWLELYDVGKIKEKLVKNTAENVRGAELTGRTPANMMLYGTPVKLLDGGPSERLYESFLDMGYARRSFFCYIPSYTLKTLSVEERLALHQGAGADALEDAKNSLTLLADIQNHGTKLELADGIFKELLTYQVFCEERANVMPEHDDMSRAEMMHRYFKCVKLSAAYAFYDQSPKVEMNHLHGAIKYTEESGNLFKKMRNRDRDYVRLAKYIASTDRQVTHVDIGEDLAFYPAGGPRRNEMINLAMAWAYKNGVVIKKHFMDSIEMFSGSMLTKTDMENLTLSCSPGLADGYSNQLATWDKLPMLFNITDFNWCNHQCINGHRAEDSLMTGFNLVVLDVDDGNTPIKTAQLLLQDFTYHIHTTKSHTEENPRYRIVLPLSHELHMQKAEYGEFMENIYDWIPIEVDRSTKDRSRKWATCAFGTVVSNDGEMLDALSFIPKTKKNDDIKERNRTMENLDNVERWFISNTGDGNRNNNLLRYAFMLADSGRDIIDVQSAVKTLNDKMADKLTEEELTNTIFQSLGKRYVRKSNAEK